MYTEEYDLEKRLVDFSVEIIDLTKNISNTYEGIHLGKQLIRSGTSAALNYGESKGAQSRNDFIHKMRISLKELRESFVCLKIIKAANLSLNKDKILKVMKENNELISIFVISINTAEGNKNSHRKSK